MGLLTSYKQWQAARKERRIERLTAQAVDLNEDQQYDLLFLHDRGFVRAKGSGQSITEIYADVENLIRKELRVIIKPGTYFVSSGGHQDMATTTEYTFTLYPCSTEHLEINAACINANRPIPGKKDRFYGVARVSDEVARFLEASENEDQMVIQAGVWTLTDNYSRYDVIEHLISRDNYGNTSHPVTHEHCDRAKAILEKLGIAHHLWRSQVPYEKKAVDYDNKSSYVGEFRHGERHGHGKYTWKEEGFYEGEWMNGDMHGKGVRDFGDGNKYVGEFQHDELHGQGKYEHNNGNSYDGEWIDGQRHGQGKFEYNSGDSYDGEWKNGKRHGEGIYIWKDGEKYVGKFEDGIEVGGWYYDSGGEKSWCFRNTSGKLEDAEPPK